MEFHALAFNISQKKKCTIFLFLQFSLNYFLFFDISLCDGNKLQVTTIDFDKEKKRGESRKSNIFSDHKKKEKLQ